jgi:hypothetical protein
LGTSVSNKHVLVAFGNVMVSHEFQGHHEGENVRIVDDGSPSFNCASSWQQDDESKEDCDFQHMGYKTHDLFNESLSLLKMLLSINVH